ncbi:hypothetical protein CXG81DRAFT_27826 [Caulochytrium protostelioides]|uniref:BHLH domain-containing protein n=1 Tax=Caulochytrium protostelioides TaxID=1555241 RepID=A0A4P9X322_9FUNG|nr:hypothetical protein CXG81DRAFT_27826 [Caulochytrium protostelioides]|eukprot:RKO99407.1 hypothetical protein CXG81DRAFT_27826 [Caulochytrium protostelioides]
MLHRSTAGPPSPAPSSLLSTGPGAAATSAIGAKGPSRSRVASGVSTVGSSGSSPHFHDAGSAPASTSASTSAAGKPLLTESEKRSNHIQSEQRRRASIRDGFAQLVSLIPACQPPPDGTVGPTSGGAAVMRSEAVVLQEAVRYIEQLLSDRTQLIARVEGLKRRTGDSSRPVHDLPGYPHGTLPDFHAMHPGPGMSAVHGEAAGAAAGQHRPAALGHPMSPYAPAAERELHGPFHAPSTGLMAMPSAQSARHVAPAPP